MRSLAPCLDLFRAAPWVTQARLLCWGVAGALVSLCLLTADVANHTALGVMNAAGEHIARDFINYWAGALLAAAGKADRAYSIPAFLAFERSLVGPASEFKIYGYPPVAMLLAWPLSWFSFVPALVLWAGSGVLLCSTLLSRAIGWRLAVLAAIGAPASFLNLLSGQNGYFTAALFAGGLMLLERRPFMAGLLLGTLCYKPQLGLLLPVALVAGGQWRAVAAAALAVAALCLATLALYGADTWLAFFHQLAFQRHLMEAGRSFWPRMPTVFAALRLLGAPDTVAWGVQSLSALLAGIAVWRVWRSAAAAEIKFAALGVAMFLATPYAWDYDMVVLLFAAGWIAVAARRDGVMPWDRIVAVALAALPLVMILSARDIGLQLGPIGLWLALAALTGRAGVMSLRSGAASARTAAT